MTRGCEARSFSLESGNPEALVVVAEAMEALDLPVEKSSLAGDAPEIRWFSSTGSVVVRGTRHSVFVGGMLLGEFDMADRDRGRRNVLVVAVAKSGVHLQRLAAAFGIGDEYLRDLRRKEEAGGPAALLLRRTGAKSKVTPAKRASWSEQFAAGMTPMAVFREQPRRGRLGYGTVWREHRAWQQAHAVELHAATKSTAAAAPPPPAPVSDGQLALWSAAMSSDEASNGDDGGPDDEGAKAIVPMTARPVRSSQSVQHAGTWLLLAVAAEMGLHEEASAAFERDDHAGLRIALDAIVCALAIKQICVEGVRRLATPSGPTLLRAARVPTATGVRRVLGRLIAETGGGPILAARMAGRLIRAARADEGPAVFYVDNHLRPYNGKEVVRKGWRMQDRRVLPGTSDYYVHDEAGCPVFRIAVPSHDSLSAELLPIAHRLRAALGADERVLLAFDRAGAHAEPLAALRDAGYEAVTYERKPYPALAESLFKPTTICGEAVTLHETRLRNLGDGRGRVRRIAIRTADGRQVNFLAISTLPAERLVEILWLRWRQENGFKHGVERWGINQLDGRAVEPYPPGTIIPNPKRRRLDRALRLARAAEGDARRDLARLPPGDRRVRAEQDLADALDRQAELESLRPSTPTHAPVEETELAGALVRHPDDYKTVIDVIRIVCANAESDLATMLAAHLRRPREAKMVVANLLAAPGKVTVTERAIHVRLAPAANRAEKEALRQMLIAVSDRKLTLPGDPKRLPLVFDLQVS